MVSRLSNRFFGGVYEQKKRKNDSQDHLTISMCESLKLLNQSEKRKAIKKVDEHQHKVRYIGL